jgi:hypothetical protein
LAIPAGLEPATYGLEGRCSILLSYGTIDGWIASAMGICEDTRTIAAASGFLKLFAVAPFPHGSRAALQCVQLPSRPNLKLSE